MWIPRVFRNSDHGPGLLCLGERGLCPPGATGLSLHVERPLRLLQPSTQAPGMISSQASSLYVGIGPRAWQRSAVGTSQPPTGGPWRTRGRTDEGSRAWAQTPGLLLCTPARCCVRCPAPQHGPTWQPQGQAHWLFHTTNMCRLCVQFVWRSCPCSEREAFSALCPQPEPPQWLR